MRECGKCGSSEDLVKDNKDGEILCRRCFTYKLFMEDFEDGNIDAVHMYNVLHKYYPKDEEKRKNLLMAIFELIDIGQKHGSSVAVTLDQIMTVGRKWNVEAALLSEALEAFFKQK